MIKILIAIAVNALALWAAMIYVPGFVISGDITTYLELAVIFMALNLIVKPILRLFFGPFIILTLGLGLFVINAVILKILDILSASLTIETIPALLWATLVIGFANFLLRLVI